MKENQEISPETLAFVKSHLDKPQITREDFMKGLNLTESEAEYVMERLLQKGLLTLRWVPAKEN